MMVHFSHFSLSIPFGSVMLKPECTKNTEQIALFELQHHLKLPATVLAPGLNLHRGFLAYLQ